MKILYYDCFAGISGDMHLGAMIDAGVDPDHLLNELNKLPLSGYKLHICRDKRKSIEGTRVDVILDSVRSIQTLKEDHHHGHDHGHGHPHSHDHTPDLPHQHVHPGHIHEQDSGHGHGNQGHHDHDNAGDPHFHDPKESNHHQNHDHEHQNESHHHHVHEHHNETHHHHHPDHEHRNLSDITEILKSSELPQKTITRALKMFTLIAEAEAKIHGVPVDEIHFHEVGAVDSIVDITGAAICLEALNPDRIYCSTIELGGGMVRCAHGRMPVPAPATAELLKGIPVKTGSTPHEATTPSGAAILAANVDEFTDSLRFRTQTTAYGIGQRDMDLPNILRVFIGEIDDEPANSDEVLLIECNIDDMNPEHYSHVMDHLFSEGAFDVFITPIIMKKSRPAAILSLLCDKRDQQKMSEIILKETTTLGVRSQSVKRMVLDRETEIIETSLGPVTVKKASYKGKLLKWKPESDDCKRVAKVHQLSIREASRIIEAELSTNYLKNHETTRTESISK